MKLKGCANVTIDVSNGKTYLVSGATGFFGKSIIEFLMCLNDKEGVNRVIALCRDKEKAENLFKQHNAKDSFCISENRISRGIDIDENVDYIFHTAGSAATKDAVTNPVDLIEANMAGTYQILEFARNHGTKGILIFSSGAVYGNVPEGMNEVSEDDVFLLSNKPKSSIYAEAKRTSELIGTSFFLQYGLPVKIVRIGHTYGPGINLNDGHIYSDIVKSICNKQDIVIRDGSQTRAFCYITDAIDGLFRILLMGEPGQAYNLSNNSQVYSMYELATKIIAEGFPELGLKVICESIGKSQPIIQNTSKLELLGWTPTVNVIEGFRKTVDYYNKISF